MRNFPLLICLSLILVSTGSTFAGGNELFFEGSYREALKEAREQDKRLILKFTAVWCGPCRQMDKTTFKDRGVRKLIETGSVILNVDIDGKEGQKLAKAHKVLRIPTIIVLEQNDESTLKRSEGFLSALDFKDQIGKQLNARTD